MTEYRVAGSTQVRVGDEVVPLGWDLDNTGAPYGKIINKAGVTWEVRRHYSGHSHWWEQGTIKLYKNDPLPAEIDVVAKLEELVLKRQEAFDAAESELEEAKSALKVVKGL